MRHQTRNFEAGSCSVPILGSSSRPRATSNAPAAASPSGRFRRTRRSNNLQADVGPAPFVRHGKTVTSETNLAAVDQGDTNGACAGHYDGPVRAAMGAKTGREAVADEVE